MVQSNDILFNEPALHSLKRAQLYSLCKRYNIKQSGKNQELIARLRMHAQMMLDQQRDASNSNNYLQDGSSQPLPAHMCDEWELVDGDHRGEDLSMALVKRPRTLSLISMMSIGAAKSHVSSKDVNMDSVSSRTSSFKSFTSSLKRVASKSSNSKLSISTTDGAIRTPLSHVFPPLSANTATPTTPRADDRSPEENLTAPIVEGTVDATTLDKNQTTIRLVTPPPRPTMDEPRISATPNLRPLSLVFPESSPKAGSEMPAPEVTVSRSRTPRKAVAPVTPADNLGISSAPFVFGSPEHTVSNLQFNNAANAILEEMNKRLGLDSTSSGAAKIGADGTLNFGEVTPSKTIFTLTTNKDEGRFGRAHEKAFEKMDSIATHYSMKRAASPAKLGPLVGTKRKTLHAVENARPNGTKVISLLDPKERTAALPATKRQKVDGADIVVKKPDTTSSSITSTVVKDDAKMPERRKSLKGRNTSGGSLSRRRPAAATVEAAPAGRLGMLRTGAAKVVKNLVSSVVNGPSTATTTTSKPAVASKAPVASAAAPGPTVPPKDTTTKAQRAPSRQTKAPTPTAQRSPSRQSKEATPTAQRAPSRQAPSRMSTASSGRPSTNAPLANTTRAVTKPVAVTRATGPVVPVKEVRRPTLTRMATSGMLRGGLPSFQNTVGSIRASVSKSVEPAKKTTASGKSATEPSNVAPAKPTRKASKANADVKQEEWPARSQSERDPDFEPEMGDGEQSRSCSPLPEPPASLSSRPLNRRAGGDSVDGHTQPSPEGGKPSSLGRKPRISRSKVIAKVHESRQEPKAARVAARMVSPLKSSKVAKVMVRPRKSAGLAAKAMLLGTDGAKGRAIVAAASAETAMRKARVSVVAGARRRTMIKA